MGVPTVVILKDGEVRWIWLDLGEDLVDSGGRYWAFIKTLWIWEDFVGFSFSPYTKTTKIQQNLKQIIDN